MKQLPNILTVSRIFLTLGFIYCVIQPGLWPVILATVLFSLASATDFYDGYFAKKYKLTSNFGKIMDPIADKFLMLSAFFIFVPMGFVPLGMFYVIFIRELFVTGTRLAAIRKGEFIAAEKAGKIKTALQVAVIFLILALLMFEESGITVQLRRNLGAVWLHAIDILLAITVLVTVISGLSYLWKNRKTLFSDFTF